MTDRERWIVYPLLFLALAAALVDKLMPARFTRVECEQLIVSGKDGGIIQCDALVAGEINTPTLAAGDIQAAGITAGEVRTAAVVVADPQGKVGAVLAMATPAASTGEESEAPAATTPPPVSGRLEIYGDGELPIAVIGPTAEAASGMIETRDAQGRPLAILSSSEAGGMLQLWHRQRELGLALGLQPEIAGLFLVDHEGKLQPLARPIDRQMMEAQPERSQKSEVRSDEG